jgi:drug/metabolite transporter (DMT)-like permease
MVRAAPGPGADVRNRGIGRGRMFLGGLILFAAVIAWSTALLMSPHSSQTVAEGTEHVRNVVVVFIRNSAFGTLVLCAISGWLLFPERRPRWPARDWAILGLIGVMVASSLYQLVWLHFVTH